MSDLLERLRDFEPEPECDNAELEILLDDVADKLREDAEEIERLTDTVEHLQKIVDSDCEWDGSDPEDEGLYQPRSQDNE